MELLTNGQFWAIFGAVIAVLIAGWGSAKGVGMVGEAAGGVVAEEPENFGQLLLLQALPGTQGIYGLLTAFVILNKIGLVGGTPIDISFYTGMLLFLASLPIAFVGYFSAVAQARTAVSAVGIVAKRPEEVAKGMIMAAMVETYAVLALLASILIIFNITV
jgi:V/A-type H+-transporting ATPase subunit K